MGVLSSRVLLRASALDRSPLLPWPARPGHLPGVRPAGWSRTGVMPQPGAARGLRARGRAARPLGDDLDPGPRCSRRARPAGRGQPLDSAAAL